MSSESAGHGGSCGVLVTTLEFVPSFWGPLQAILDRLLHHSVTINIRGDSYRLRERKKAGLLSSPQRPKVSTQPDETGEF